MDEGVGKQEPVIPMGNEAESMPVREEEEVGLNLLDVCPVCNLNFHSREPKLLPCLHSFCKKCLPSPSRNLAIMASPVDSATTPLNVIRCPVCRQECMEMDVMENFFVRDSVEAPSSTVERPVQVSVSGLVRTDVFRSQAHGVSAQRPVFCDTHKKEPLKLYCETCDLLTCRDCQLLKHRDHNYQFLEDAYNTYTQQMEAMTCKLQDKKKVVKEVSDSINNRLLQVDQNRTSVYNDIKRSISSLIFEISQKGKTLVNELEALTKDHEGILRKQQEDIGYLSKHLDHVISFAKWAMSRNRAAALLHCKRLILFQIANLLGAKCNPSFLPQSTVRFQCRSSYWASNVDLGSLVMENAPSHPLGGAQGIPQPPAPAGRGPFGPFTTPGPRLATSDTLAQLQMQVDKLAPQPHWQPQQHPPPPRTWYQSVHLPRTAPGPLQRISPSQSLPHLPHQPSRRFMVPPPNPVGPSSCLLGPGYTPQPQRGMVSSSSYQPKSMDVVSSSLFNPHDATLPANGGLGSPHSCQLTEPAYLNKREDAGGPAPIPASDDPRSLQAARPYSRTQGRATPPACPVAWQEEKPTYVDRVVSCKAPETQQPDGAPGSAAKRRRRLSPGPVIIIKDEAEDDAGYVQSNQRASLPDSTGDQHQPPGPAAATQQQLPPPPPMGEDKPRPPRPPPSPGKQSQADVPSSAGTRQAEWCRALAEDSGEDRCAVCQSGGELQRCDKCPKVFRLTCHIPVLSTSPRQARSSVTCSEGFCCLCRDLSEPATEDDCENKPEAKTVKEEPGLEGGMSPADTWKCKRLLLWLFCSKMGSDFCRLLSSMQSSDNSQVVKDGMDFSTVKRKLESGQTIYQSPAEFISDVRLIFRNCATLNEADTKVALAGRKLEELFEEHLRIFYPDWTFPEDKMEVINPAIHPDDKTSQHALCQHRNSDSQSALSTPAR
ncbi:transcription intermediary factor 1-alpha-like [Lampris incognitus]|uniref:transcription intermediary factor 1-alpha-like n=1 Tax=Lampris incognitus TaxID=2546036 RepID=UPI0024B56E54|nr:transcription intermediary factor 1-alpha-like [Lampris incognitus]